MREKLTGKLIKWVNIALTREEISVRGPWDHIALDYQEEEEEDCKKSDMCVHVNNALRRANYYY